MARNTTPPPSSHFHSGFSLDCLFVVLAGDGEQVVPAAGVGGQDDRGGGGGGQRPGTQLCPSLILTNYILRCVGAKP
jgi:hypothetical protein